MDDRVKVVICAYERGGGGGTPRMETLYYRFLNRERFEPVIVILSDENPDDIAFDPSIPYLFTGTENRFQRLLEILSDKDIALFAGSFDPFVCEAARVSRIPVLIEVMHLVEPGQVFPAIDLTICVSETVRRVQPDREKSAVVFNGVNIHDFPFPTEPGTNGRIVFLESTRREKAAHFHLDELADMLLPMDEAIELWLAGRSQTGPSTDRVKFLGLREDIADLYRQADFMVLFSKKEPFGLVALEAMASGCLPIVSNDGGFAEFVTHGVDGWVVQADDKNAIRNTFQEALSLRGTERFETMRLNARAAVEERFSGEACLRQYETLFLKCIEEKGRRGIPGPTTVPMPPDACVGEALISINADNWATLEAAVLRLSEHPEPIVTQQSAIVIEMIATVAFEEKRFETAERIYRKLYESGFRFRKWLENWLVLLPETGALQKKVLAELADLAPDDVNLVMLRAERFLKAGDILGAVNVLEKGIENVPQSEDLKKVCDLLKQRLMPT